MEEEEEHDPNTSDGPDQTKPKQTGIGTESGIIFWYKTLTCTDGGTGAVVDAACFFFPSKGRERKDTESD